MLCLSCLNFSELMSQITPFQRECFFSSLCSTRSGKHKIVEKLRPFCLAS